MNITRNQSQKQQQQQGTDDKRPAGTAYAVVPNPDPDAIKEKWIELGAVWEVSGGFSLELLSEPLAWRRLQTRRRIVIQLRKDGAR